MLSDVLPLCRLNDVLEYAEDHECDVPKFWDYIAELLAPSVAHKGFPLVTLKQAHEGPLESGKIGKLVAKTLHKCTSLQVSIGDRSTDSDSRRNATWGEAIDSVLISQLHTSVKECRTS